VQHGAGLRRAGEVQGSNPSSVLVQFSNSFDSNPLSSIVPMTTWYQTAKVFFPSAMNSGTGIGNKEGEVTLVDVLWRSDAIIELL
jgi:hypothetical protein